MNLIVVLLVILLVFGNTPYSPIEVGTMRNGASLLITLIIVVLLLRILGVA